MNGPFRFARGRSPAGSGRRREAFTLVELLAGLAILSILVLLLGRFLAVSTTAWDLGMAQAESNTSGRAIMDFIARDLSMAMADETTPFRLVSDASQTYNSDPSANSDALLFASLGNKPEVVGTQMRRSAAQVIYYLAEMRDGEDEIIEHRFRLMRVYVSDPDEGYYDAYQYDSGSGPDWTDPPDLIAPDVVAENISAFQVWVYPEVGDEDQFDYFSGDFGDKLPAYADIYLELLGEDDAIRAAAMAENPSSEVETFVRRRASGFVTRVYFNNRVGYNRGKF